MQLPKLRSLDIGFICRHFEIAQLVPKALKGLRIEFYESDALYGCLTASEIRWLIEYCPDLERLELDISPFTSLTGGIDQRGAWNFLHAISGFQHLRVLRLLPSYWPNGHLVTSPLPNDLSPVAIFRWLSKRCPSLRKLIICISVSMPFVLNIAARHRRVSIT